MGEEGGAALMIKEGVLNNPKVDVIFGLHIQSLLPLGQLAYRPEGIMAAEDGLNIRVKRSWCSRRNAMGRCRSYCDIKPDHSRASDYCKPPERSYQGTGSDYDRELAWWHPKKYYSGRSLYGRYHPHVRSGDAGQDP